MKMKKSKGFTLIELLVVIAIIGILATIVLVSLNSARQKARDTRRISDVRQIALALEMYYDDNGAYPGDADAAACDDWAALVTAIQDGGQMTVVPTDPGGSVAYAYNTNLTDYVLRAQLESATNTAFNTDVDLTTLGCACDDATRYYCLQP
jgi:type II secretion system protein G